jgi:PLP dependent protein
MIAVDQVGAALSDLRARITAAGGRDVTIVAVTKGFGVDAWAAAARAGLTDIGENYAQDALAKRQEWPAVGLGAPPRLHFIGRLQRNKVRSLAGAVALWQSVDRPSVVDEIAQHAPGAAVLVQVNITGEEQKGGCAPTDAHLIVERGRDAGLDVRGVMGVGPLGSPEDARPGFARLRALADDLGLHECSMGMSDDLEVAVAEGATMVRIGSALFGPRPDHQDPDSYVAVRRQQ